MNLTTEALQRFIGGDFEVQNGGENYLFRGPIKSAKVEDGDVVLEFDWFARNDGGPNSPTPTWNAYPTADYSASLLIYHASDIGGGRICLQSPITGEIGILFLPGHNLDPSKVKGLPTAA